MSTYTRASKIWGIILSATLALSGIGTAFAVEGGTPESTPPSAPSAEGTGEPGDSSTLGQTPSGENQGAAPSAGEADSGTSTGSTGEGANASTDLGAGLATATGAATQASPKAGEVTITSESQLKGIFLDPTLRAIVFEAVKNGTKGAKGTDVWDALANYTGNIDAMGPYAGKPGHGMDLIEKAEGIQYLRNAGTVDIRFNNIEDLSFAAQEQPGPNEDPVEGTKNKWYGGESEEGLNPHNVTWHIAGNPLRTIPEYFGGRMVIEQPAAWFSHYANDNEIHSYVRGDGDDSFSGTFQIGRVKYSGPDKKDQFVEIDNIKDSAKSNPLRTSLDTDNDTMQFSGLIKSGKHTIVVGTKEIFNYDTEAELMDFASGELIWALTPGAQSFKYLTSPTFYVYDKVKLEQTTFQGSVELTKTDATGNTPLAVAEYSLYKKGADAPLQTGLKTNANGKLPVSDLDGGSYYFVETKAPDGYLINTQPIPFTIDTPHTTLGGGKKTIDNLEGGASPTAGEGEVFIAGPEDGDYSPNIELTLDGGTPDEVASVEVTYSKLEGAPKDLMRSFDTLQAAQNDINSEKNANRIVGPVSIKVNYRQGGAVPTMATVGATNAKQEKINVSGTKTWVDNKGWTGERPAATVHLLRDGKDTGKKATIPKSTSAQTSGKYEFTGLDRYDPTDGHEYQYTVKEDPVYITYKDPDTGFEDTQAYILSYSGTNGTDITNTWPDGTRINIKGKKLWDDFNNADGKRPGSVTLELWQSEPGGTPVLYNTATATAADSWEYHFELVPKFVKDADGKETDKRYQYTVKEKRVEGYEECPPLAVDTFGVNDKQDSLDNDLTNTFVNDIVEVSGTKAWKNDTEADRPASVTVELLQNGKPFTPVKAQEATSAGGWKYAFTGLPKYDAAGQEYVYTVRETKVPDGYAQEIGTAKNGYAVMNTRIPLIDIPVTKVWKDNADYTGGHLSVTIRLLQNGVEIGHVELSENSDTPWEHTFTGLHKTDAAGKEYRYTVTEDPVTAPGDRAGYKTTITGDPAGGFTVTNEWTKEDLINISGKKVWEGDDAIAARERPDHVVLVLYRDGAEYSHTTATAEGNWEYSFKSLPKHQDTDSAKESVYTIEEELVDGYFCDIPEISPDEVRKAQNGDTIGKDITNVFNNNVVTVSGIKQWVGDTPADRPESVTVELVQNGRAFKTGIAAAKGNWRYRFDNLPQYDSAGNLYTYTVNESAIPEGYAAKVSGTTITNTRIPLIEIPVTKVWENNDGFTGNNPDVVVHLLQNDVIIDTATIVAPVDATPGGWYEATHVFKGPDDKGLPATDQAGVPYVYKVTEDEVVYQDGRKGYRTTILGDEKSGFTVINEWTEEDYIGIAGQKRWAADDAVQDAVRPNADGVTLVLWCDGVEYRRLTVKAADNWAFSFGQLPKHKTGSSGMVESEYRITELPVEGYAASLPEITVDEVEATPHGGMIAGKDVVNTFDNSTSVSVRKVWEDSDNAAGKRPDSIEAVLLQNGKPFGDPVTLTGPEWRHTWGGLQEFNDAGELFVYTVEERNVPAGYSSRLGEGSQGGFVIINAADAPPGDPGTPGTPGTPDTPPGTPAVSTGDALAGVALALAAAAALGVGAMAVAARRARARQP